MIIDLPEPIAIVCHDAGAANVIQGWLAQEERDVRPLMAGPAEALWRDRFPSRGLCPSLEAALSGAASLLSGTGWASDLEHRARTLARDLGLPSAAVIDHWVNYRERFVRDGETVLPDALWVTDGEAERLARAAFPDSAIGVKPNLYLEEQAARVRASPPSGGDILYVAEPARSDWGRDRPGEFQALDYFMAHRDRLGLPPDLRLRLRPHPSDPAGKYDDWLAAQAGRVVALDRSRDLAEAMAGAEWVVGGQSFALVVALAAGRRAVSALPPWAPTCALPHEGLIHLKRLARGDGTSLAER